MDGYIFLKDGYDEGFNKGHADALGGKSRNAMGLGSKEGFKYLTGLTNREGYYESFCEGYNAGFAQGMIDSKKTPNENKVNITNTNKNKDQMSSYKSDREQRAESFQKQITIMEELLVSINKLKSSLETVSAVYQRKLGQLEDAGLLAELSDTLRRNAFETTNQKINALVEHLENEDVPFINRVINGINEKLPKY